MGGGFTISLARRLAVKLAGSGRAVIPDLAFLRQQTMSEKPPRG